MATPYAEPARRLLPKFDAYAYSFDVGHIKPDPEIYQHLLDKLGVPPDKALMVGDTVLADVEGPRKVGIRSLHLVRGLTGEEGVVGSLPGLIEHL